jgi:Fur family transcriptional regulator, peroxide stress response regulator
VSNQEKHHRLLAQKGLKATPQRRLILAALLARHDHPTAEALYTELLPQLPGLSLGTVYSTLETLVRNELARRVPVAEGSMRYDGHTGSHHHIYCSATAQIRDYHDPELDLLIHRHLAKKGFPVLDIQSISLHICGRQLTPDAGIGTN